MHEVIRDRETHFLLSHARDRISEERSEMFLVSPSGSTFSLCVWVCTKIYICAQGSAPLEEREYFFFFLAAQCTFGKLNFSELVAKN